MTFKSYSHNCGLASALDVIGDRWTWLVLRSLFCGPARFGELLEQLPGIGTNLLSSRLRQLSENAVIQKEGQGKQSAYQLTEKGEALRTVAHLLARWGKDYMPQAGGKSMPQWSMFNMEAAFLSEAAGELDALVEFRLADFVFHIVIRRGICRARAGSAIAPDVTIHSPDATLTAGKARMRIEGDREKFAEIRKCFDL